MRQRCEHTLHLGVYLPWQQMVVAQKNMSVTYIRIGTYLEVYRPMVFPCRVSNTARFFFFILWHVQEFTGPYTALFMQFVSVHVLRS